MHNDLALFGLSQVKIMEFCSHSHHGCHFHHWVSVHMFSDPFGAYFMPLPLWNYNRPRIKFFLLLLRRACDRPATYIKHRIVIFHVSWDLLKTAPFDLLPQWPQCDVSLIIPCAVSFDDSSCLSNSNSIFLFVLSVYPSASQMGCSSAAVCLPVCQPASLFSSLLCTYPSMFYITG